MSGFIIYSGVMADSAPPFESYIMIGMTVMCFCPSYLYPQFKQKDERMKLIREKGMFVSFFAMMMYLIAFNLGLKLDLILLTASEAINILSTLLICTLFLSFVIYSKIY
ncbi:permease [Cytobacillus firmus]|uniref:permease n=1 Tax=Cytobacillus firmus TaxID=1399 RepID=UPI0021630D52|nr:permease [Cytobacillus firmus]MCS0670359.1 permease [Cytobacillus firmus]